MANGNVFNLILNDGKQDVFLNATQLLQNRIKDIRAKELKRIVADDYIYFTNTNNSKDQLYKNDIMIWKKNPVAYATSKISDKNILYEMSKTHKSFIGFTYKPFVSTAFSYIKIVEKAGSSQFSNEISFTIPQIGTWIHDMCLHVKLTGLKAMDSRDKVRYCDLLGHRLIERVKFEINNVVIDEYTTELYNKYFQFHVPTHKKKGWLRNIGQEEIYGAYITPNPATTEYREFRQFSDGAQTYKYEQPEIDMYIPILFWFNLHVSQSFPNIKIPKGQVKIKITFASLDKLVDCADYGGGGKYIHPVIATSDLYVNHISTVPEVEKLILDSSQSTLIRVNKILEKTLTHAEDEILLKELKFATEHIALGFRPMENEEHVDTWHRNSALTVVDVLSPVNFINSNGTPVLATNYARYYTENQVVDYLGLSIDDIELFQYDTVKKYSGFYPFVTESFNTPDDPGWMLMNNQINPADLNPSGHINMSQNRKIYIKYKSSYINGTNRTKLIVIAQAINFLIIKNNSAYVKYI